MRVDLARVDEIRREVALGPRPVADALAQGEDVAAAPAEVNEPSRARGLVIVRKPGDPADEARQAVGRVPGVVPGTAREPADRGSQPVVEELILDEGARQVPRGKRIHGGGALHERGVEAARQAIEAEGRFHLPDPHGPDHREVAEPDVEVVEEHALVRDAELDLVVDGPEQEELPLREEASAPDLSPVVDVWQARADVVRGRIHLQLEPDCALYEWMSLHTKRPELRPERYKLTKLVMEA